MERTDRTTLIWAAMFALAVIVWACASWWPQFRNEFFVIMGNRNEAGGYYGFWSGFAGATRTIEYLVVGALLYWHHTCHYSMTCLRWGKYAAAGGLFKLCHHHHPDLGGMRPDHNLIHRLHRERS